MPFQGKAVRTAVREKGGKARATPRAQPCCWRCPAAPLWTRHTAEGQRLGLLPAGLREEGEEPAAGRSPAGHSAHGRDGKGPHKAALELGWLSVALPGTARTQPAAAACSRVAPRQEAPGFWYFLRVRLAGGHLYSLDASTSWYSTYSFQAGNQCLSSVSKPFCPETEPS